MSFLNTLMENVASYPDKIALEFMDPPVQRVTYRELDQLVQETCGFLGSLGVQPGDRVALQLPKSLEFILLHLATLRVGAICLPLNVAYPPDEIEYFLSDSQARLFFAHIASKGSLEGVVSRLPELSKTIYLDPPRPNDFLSRIATFPIP